MGSAADLGCESLHVQVDFNSSQPSHPDIMEEMAQKASAIRNLSPAAEGNLAKHATSRERRITGSRTPGVVGGVDRLLPPHRDAVGAVKPATKHDNALVADLGSQPSDPDVWPVPTPKPLRDALQAVPEAASAAAESYSYGSVSRFKRESAAAVAATASAREKARLTTPPPAEGAIHRRSSGGGGGVGSSGGKSLAAARGGANGKDAVVRG